jgi:hypothetical protein
MASGIGVESSNSPRALMMKLSRYGAPVWAMAAAIPAASDAAGIVAASGKSQPASASAFACTE